MEKRYQISCFCEGNMFTITDTNAPQINNTFECEGVKYRIINSVHIITMSNDDNAISYYNCIVERLELDKTFVVQVKFIQGCSYEEIEKSLNKFLYENRHRYEILSIDYGLVISVKYRQRNKRDYWVSVENEKSYRMK